MHKAHDGDTTIIRLVLSLNTCTPVDQGVRSGPTGFEHMYSTYKIEVFPPANAVSHYSTLIGEGARLLAPKFPSNHFDELVFAEVALGRWRNVAESNNGPSTPQTVLRPAVKP